jgi:hypothetical protein
MCATAHQRGVFLPAKQTPQMRHAVLAGKGPVIDRLEQPEILLYN